ncbi:spermatogenesis-associated protein 4 [Lobulomyces angularis]|nr:spermatogenesis-associated protein 4 [Lobulomyces angularis]
MSLSRILLKWIQSLDLSYAIKNCKRDFANGFLIAQIISKYRSDLVGMHSFDTGSGPAARRANWDLLTKIFIKLELNISEKLTKDVSSCSPTAAPKILEIIYQKFEVEEKNALKKGEVDQSNHTENNVIDFSNSNVNANNLGSKANSHQSLIKKFGCNDTFNSSNAVLEEFQNFEENFSQRISVVNPNFNNKSQKNETENLTCNTNEIITNKNSVVFTYLKSGVLMPVSSASEQRELIQNNEDSTSGKVAIMKVVVNLIFQCLDVPNNWFGRLSYQMFSLRDIISRRFSEDKVIDDELNSIKCLLEEKDAIIFSTLKSSLPSDISIYLDTFLGLIVSSDINTLVFKVSKLLISHISQRLHHLNFISPIKQLDPFQRLLNTKEIQNFFFYFLLQPKSEKFWHMVEIVHNFAENISAIEGYEVPEGERISGLLTIKSYIKSLAKQHDSRIAITSFNSCFISFLFLFIHFENPKKLLKNSQLSTLYLSESLTVLNSSKPYFLNANQSSLKNDIVLDCTFALHILAHLAHCGVSSIWSVIDDEGGILKKIIVTKISQAVSSVVVTDALLNGSVRLIASILELKGSDNNNMIGQLLEITAIYLNILTDEPLMTALYLIGSVLERYPKLSSVFVKGIMSLNSKNRLNLMQTQTNSQEFTINWGINSILSSVISNYGCKNKAWWVFGIGFGLVNAVTANKCKLSACHFEILKPIAILSMLSLNDSNVKIRMKNKLSWKEVFNKLCELVLISLTQADCVKSAVSCLNVFARFGVFDDNENMTSLLTAILFVFKNSQGPHSRNQVFKLISAWIEGDDKLFNREKTNCNNPEEGQQLACAAENEIIEKACQEPVKLIESVDFDGVKSKNSSSENFTEENFKGLKDESILNKTDYNNSIEELEPYFNLENLNNSDLVKIEMKIFKVQFFKKLKLFEEIFPNTFENLPELNNLLR